MIANFVLILFRIPLSGIIDGWISNNTNSTNIFVSGRLGGFQGGGPNVIGIFCAIYSLICVYKLFTAKDPKKIFNRKQSKYIPTNTFIDKFTFHLFKRFFPRFCSWLVFFIDIY